jgi:UDP-N-acetylglucosamine--N-acetylmuramyl-(pentapeptide) pyrophosphoryl-undecaprenol N-acetylglucosamine transferase
MIRRLGLAVGDTAGHVFPALALAEAFASASRRVEVCFFSAADGAAKDILPGAGYPLHVVPASRVARANPFQAMAALGRAAIGAGRARRILADVGTRLVIGTGGYGSFGVVLAARSLGLTTAIVELNAIPGLANRCLGRVVRRVYLAFPEAASHFAADKVLLAGVPVRQSAHPPHDYIRERPHGRAVRLLIVSGTRGDAFFTQRGPELAADLHARSLPVEVTHQLADRCAPEVQRAYRERGIVSATTPFIDDMGAAMREADVVVARGGANTLAEIALARVPSLIVPLADSAADHQAHNARSVASRGAADWIREVDWTPGRVAGMIVAVIRDDGLWRSRVSALERLGVAGAADRIVRDCEQLMEARW